MSGKQGFVKLGHRYTPKRPNQANNPEFKPSYLYTRFVRKIMFTKPEEITIQIKSKIMLGKPEQISQMAMGVGASLLKSRGPNLNYEVMVHGGGKSKYALCKLRQAQMSLNNKHFATSFSSVTPLIWAIITKDNFYSRDILLYNTWQTS